MIAPSFRMAPVVVASLAFALPACGVDRDNTWWEDEWCNDPPRIRTADIETVYVGLFKPDGTPWCIRDAEVKVSQWSELYPKVCKPFTLSEEFIALRRVMDGSMGVAGGPFPGSLAGETDVPIPCNLYIPDVRRDPDAYAWIKCFEPLYYEVEAAGCEPASGMFTWNDNWYPWKSSEHDHWYVPVVMDCPGRAADGSLLETPAGGER